MPVFFIYNSENTRDKLLVRKADEMNMGVQYVDIAQDVEEQLNQNLDNLPMSQLVQMLDSRIVEKNGLDNRKKLLRYVESRPHIIKTPALLKKDWPEPILVQEDLLVPESAVSD